MPRISAFTPATNADSAQLAAAQAGASVRVTPAQIVATALAGVAAPPAVAAAGAAGAATTAARSDHTHAHGNQAGGALHADVVDGGASGFMTGAQAAKLSGIEALADVTDAANVNAAGAVMESDFTTTHAILVRQGAATPAALAIPLSSFVGRIGSGDVIALTTAQSKTLLAYVATEVGFTPNGDIAATTVQGAIVEVRDDTDTKLASKANVAGQIGGTAASPTILGARETSGPTLLTYGAIADGQLLGRVGAEIVGVVPSGGGEPPADLLEGFTTGNRYDGGAADIPGADAGFLAAALVEIQVIDADAGQSIFNNINFGTDGWQIGIESGLRPLVAARVASGYQQALYPTSLDGPFLGMGLLLIVLRMFQAGADRHVELWLQGRRVLAATTETGSYVPAAGAPQVGAGPFGNVAASTGILGLQYLAGTLTATQLRAHFAACLAARDVVAAGQGWTSWSVKRGTPGASWAPSDGAGPTLSRTGALTQVARAGSRFLS